MEKQINMQYYRNLVNDVLLCSNAVQIADEVFGESEKWLPNFPNFYELFLQAIDEVYEETPSNYDQYDVEGFELVRFSHFLSPKLHYAASFALYKIDVLDKPIAERIKNKFGISTKFYPIIKAVVESLFDAGYKVVISKEKSAQLARIFTVDHLDLLSAQEKSLRIGCTTTQFVYICDKIADLTQDPINISSFKRVTFTSKEGNRITPGNFYAQSNKIEKRKMQLWQVEVDRIFEEAQLKLNNFN
jgi:hypothetical protein